MSKQVRRPFRFFSQLRIFFFDFSFVSFKNCSKTFCERKSWLRVSRAMFIKIVCLCNYAHRLLCLLSNSIPVISMISILYSILTGIVYEIVSGTLILLFFPLSSLF
jgi:hypothetical protein